MAELSAAGGGVDGSTPLPVSVVVPARNATRWLGACLSSLLAQHPREIIVVDGCSTDGTAEIARAAGAVVLSDGGRGVAAARMLGIRAAACATVALVDSDVLVPPGALARLLREFSRGRYDGLQFALASQPDGAGYWGRALSWHHNHSRVRRWFGVSATLVRRDVLLRVGFDDTFSSGEDIDLRFRLQADGHRIGVSTDTYVQHRFADTFAAAKDQWTQDGAGLARTARKHRDHAAWVLGLPLLAAIRGLALASLTAPRYVPYWLGFVAYNYKAMLGELLSRRGGGLSMSSNAGALAAARILPMLAGLAFWAVAARTLPATEVGLGSTVVAAALLVVQLALLGIGPATVTLLPRHPDEPRRLALVGVGMVAVSATVAALAVVAVTTTLGDGIALAWRSDGVVVAFVAAAVLATASYQLDHVAVARRRAHQALGRSALQATAQLMVLVVLLAAGSRTVLPVVVAVAGAAALSAMVGIAELPPARPPGSLGRLHRRALLGELARTGLPNHALMLADRSIGYLLPLLVAAVISPAAAARWYMVWMLAAAVLFVPQSVGYALQARLAHGTPDITATVRRALALAVGGGGVLAAGLAVLGPEVLPVLGSSYRVDRTTLLPLCGGLVLAGVTQVYYGVCRARGALAEATAAAALAALVCLVPAGAAAHRFGLLGIALLFGAGQAAAAVVAIARLGPVVRRLAGPGHPAR